jgi:hypothetical protein
MKTCANEPIVKGTIANALAENSFQSFIPVATPIVRLTKGIHRVTQHTDKDVCTCKSFSNFRDQLGTVRSRTAAVLAS